MIEASPLAEIIAKDETLGVRFTRGGDIWRRNRAGEWIRTAGFHEFPTRGQRIEDAPAVALERGWISSGASPGWGFWVACVGLTADLRLLVVDAHAGGSMGGIPGRWWLPALDEPVKSLRVEDLKPIVTLESGRVVEALKTQWGPWIWISRTKA